jgi:hypothetical protein
MAVTTTTTTTTTTSSSSSVVVVVLPTQSLGMMKAYLIQQTTKFPNICFVISLALMSSFTSGTYSLCEDNHTTDTVKPASNETRAQRKTLFGGKCLQCRGYSVQIIPTSLVPAFNVTFL